MFYNTTFAPAFERERRYKMMKQTFRKKSSEIIWKFKIKVLIFAATFAKRKRQKSSLRDLHNSTSSPKSYFFDGINPENFFSNTCTTC